MVDFRGERHRFRFFLDVEAPTLGELIALGATDAAHIRVLRLDDGARVEVVDRAGNCFDAVLRGDRVELGDATGPSPATARIELVAGALVGGRFDELVDGAVQAGASRIVPFATSRADRERLGARRARLQRIARAAAKQAKRAIVPDVDLPIGEADLVDGPIGIIVDAAAPTLLDDAVRATVEAARAACVFDEPIRLLVGPAAGLSPTLVQQLIERGWIAGRLGPSILRAELAAAVAVAIAAMHAPRS